MKTILIIGGGPAGVSAALYTLRSGSVNTVVVAKDLGALSKSEKIENYYGFAMPITGKQLCTDGKSGALRLGATWIEDEVVDISFTEKFSVICTSSQYEADAVLIATGVSRNVPKIDGFSDFEGKGVSYCAVCDAFFYKNKTVAVLGNASFAAAEAAHLADLCNIIVLTNGEKAEFEGYKTDTRKISKLFGDKTLEGVIFEDDRSLAISGLFVALGTAGSTALAAKLGAVCNENKIVTDDKMATNIPGLYAAGDCTGTPLQIYKAVYEGATAGINALKFLKR